MLLHDPDLVAASIQRFLSTARQPVLLEPGDEQILLSRNNFALERHDQRLVLQAWDSQRNLARRVTGIESEKKGALKLRIEKFGGKSGKLLLLDIAKVTYISPDQLEARMRFRERFRRMLLRQFPAWGPSELSVEANLQHSLSPSYCRAVLRKGGSMWAAIGAAPESTPEGALAFGLIWLELLRKREKSRRIVEGLALFLPAGRETTTCLRMRWLDPAAARYGVFVYSEDGFEDRVDLSDQGNLDSRVEPRASSMMLAHSSPWVAKLVGEIGAQVVERSDGVLSFRIHGLEFAALDPLTRELHFGVDARRKADPNGTHWPEILNLAEHLRSMRAVENAALGNSLYLRNPELWLESQVRREMEEIDPLLLPDPVYGQVPAVTGLERGVIDLLAADRNGRLAVIELKATQDLQLPLQALDYWIRVRHHALAGDFARGAYFPGLELRAQDPRLLLVAPALEFHPTTETVLRYFDPSIEVERIGLGAGWRQRVAVMFRTRGYDSPGLAS